jgi:hypothetical protein
MTWSVKYAEQRSIDQDLEQCDGRCDKHAKPDGRTGGEYP